MKTALDVALAYLSKRLLTRFEMLQRLEMKGFSSEEVEGTLKRLVEWGYLNDREYALSYSRTKQVSYSKKRIEVELKRRGIEEELIEEVLEETYRPIQELALCRQQAQKLWLDESRRWESSYQFKKSYAKIPRTIFLRQRVGQKLLQKGYSLEIITNIIDEITGRD
jgi:regulatory protein